MCSVFKETETGTTNNVHTFCTEKIKIKLKRKKITVLAFGHTHKHKHDNDWQCRGMRNVNKYINYKFVICVSEWKPHKDIRQYFDCAHMQRASRYFYSPYRPQNVAMQFENS